MKKAFKKFQVGTAAYVVAHGLWQQSHGKNPSETFLTNKNPREAFNTAKNILSAVESYASVGGLMASVGQSILSSPTKLPYDQMTKPEILAAVRHIVASSSTEKEVQERIKTELGCPYGVMTHVLHSLSRIAGEAKELCLAMGGVTLKTGELIQVMLWGPQGESISV